MRNPVREHQKKAKKIVVVLNGITWYEYAQQQMKYKVLKANQTYIFMCTYLYKNTFLF